jgi:hypothetical protein
LKTLTSFNLLRDISAKPAVATDHAEQILINLIQNTPGVDDPQDMIGAVANSVCLACANLRIGLLMGNAPVLIYGINGTNIFNASIKLWMIALGGYQLR